MSGRALAVVSLGHLPYEAAHALQRLVSQQRITGTIDRDVLLLVEHEPTITLGRGTKATSLPHSVDQLRAGGLTVVDVERGGDVTWHGPGQLVGYPILDLQQHKQDLHWYLRQIEEVLIRGLAALEIPAERNPGYTGVWTGGRKIASIGIHVRQWVTTHGFALNVHNDLAAFDAIVPCGIAGVQMTSVNDEYRRLGRPAPSWDLVSAAMVTAVGEVFGLTPRLEPALAEEWLAVPRAG